MAEQGRAQLIATRWSRELELKLKLLWWPLRLLEGLDRLTGATGGRGFGMAEWLREGAVEIPTRE